MSCCLSRFYIIHSLTDQGETLCMKCFCFDTKRSLVVCDFTMECIVIAVCPPTVYMSYCSIVDHVDLCMLCVGWMFPCIVFCVLLLYVHPNIICCI